MSESKPAPTTSEDAKVQSASSTGYGVIIAIVLILFAVTGIRSCNAKREAKKASAYSSSASAAPSVEALVLEKECFTPCSADIEWPFKIRTDGDPLRIKFQGTGWFDHPGKGYVQAPSQMQSGNTEFISPDEKNPRVRVQVYRKVQY
jgi:hypothetical protein